MTTSNTTDLTTLRRDLAQARRALLVNSGAYARQHGAALLRELIPAGPRSRRATAQLLDGLTTERDWTPALRRALAQAVATLSGAARERGPGSEAAERMLWHRDRLMELAAQDEAVRALAAALDRARPPLWRAAS